MTTTRIVTLVQRPTNGEPQPRDFALENHPVPDRGATQLLVKNIVMSVDPSMRGRLETSEKQYTTNFEIGGQLDGSCIGVVLESDTRSAHRAPWSGTAAAGGIWPSSTTIRWPSFDKNSLLLVRGSA